MRILLVLLALCVSNISYAVRPTIEITSTYYIDNMMHDLSDQEVLFANTVKAHFQRAKDCWKQRRLPSDDTIDRIIIGCVVAARRFWPEQSGIPYKIFAIIISESKGINKGNPADPSYGMCHTTYEASRHACELFHIERPTGKWDLIEKLEHDIIFNITCGGGELKICEAQANGDWVRAVLIYKYGIRGFGRAANGLNAAPITELKVWRDYSKLYLSIKCIKSRIENDAETRCGCEIRE